MFMYISHFEQNSLTTALSSMHDRLKRGSRLLDKQPKCLLGQMMVQIQKCDGKAFHKLRVHKLLPPLQMYVINILSLTESMLIYMDIKV